MIPDVPNFEAEATEETISGREKLDTGAAARRARAWAENNIAAVEQAKLRDNRPQHEGKRKGAVTFTFRLAPGTGIEGLTDVYEWAEEIDAEGVSTTRISLGDHVGQYRVVVSNWSADYPVYSDYFGGTTSAYPTNTTPSHR